MNKMMTIALALLSVSMLAQARTVTGVVKGENKPLGSVLVTDGFSFAQTDAKGNYSLDVNDKARFVYIVTPKGYVADYSTGVPQFYQRLEEGKDTYSFALQAMKGDKNRYAMITMADPQLDVDTDIDKLYAEALPDIRETAAKHKDVQVAGIVLGDISWDVYSHNEIYKDFAKKAGFPIYPVIGNHDFDKYLAKNPDANYAHCYERDFGPTYYAFQLGDAYYVVLNDMLYTGNKGYVCTLKMEDQWNWLMQLLRSAINMDNLIYIAMHAPVKPAEDSGLIGNGQELLNVLHGKFQATFITGHHHHNTNKDLGGGIMEHNIGALCGNWWTSPVSSDGAPRGYQVFEGNGRQHSWYFKATGYPDTYQMKVYPVGRVMDRPNAVVAKIWNVDDGWHVRYYEDGVLKGDMSRFYSYDPDYCEYVNGARVIDDYVPFRTRNYFSAIPTEGAKELTVEAQDRFGRIYKETIRLK